LPLASIVRGRLVTLDLISERFRARLAHEPRRRSTVRSRYADQGAQHQRFADAIGAVKVPSALYVVNYKPLACQGLLVLDAALVGALTDAFFGGTGRDVRHAAGAELTPGEWRLATKCFELCVAELRTAWSSVVPLEVELVRLESNPQFAAIVPASAPMLVRRFRISLEATGELTLLLPLAGLDAVREQLQSATPGKPGRQCRPDLEAALKDSVLQLETVFSRIEITLGTLVNLRPGDVIEIERPTTSRACGRQPVFNARYGISSGRNAVQVLGPAARQPPGRAQPERRSA
jgi:flagellar motor switch protein FliM